jgi:hypothetical protein
MPVVRSYCGMPPHGGGKDRLIQQVERCCAPMPCCTGTTTTIITSNTRWADKSNDGKIVDESGPIRRFPPLYLPSFGHKVRNQRQWLVQSCTDPCSCEKQCVVDGAHPATGVDGRLVGCTQCGMASFRQGGPFFASCIYQMVVVMAVVVVVYLVVVVVYLVVLVNHRNNALGGVIGWASRHRGTAHFGTAFFGIIFRPGLVNNPIIRECPVPPSWRYLEDGRPAGNQHRKQLSLSPCRLSNGRCFTVSVRNIGHRTRETLSGGRRSFGATAGRLAGWLGHVYRILEAVVTAAHLFFLGSAFAMA